MITVSAKYQKFQLGTVDRYQISKYGYQTGFDTLVIIIIFNILK